MKKFLLLFSIFACSLLLSSCGGSGSTIAQSDSKKLGTLKIGVKFPSSNGLNAQILDPNIQCIEVTVVKPVWYSDYYYYDYYSKKAILTPDNPQATITGIPVGANYVYVHATDGTPSEDGNYCTGNTIDYASAYAEIVEGENQFVINLLRAKWTFVDQDGNPTSITLNGTLSTSNESINGFYVLPTGGVFPVSIDPGKPVMRHDYDVLFFGENLNACNSSDPTLCPSRGYYTLQLIGPNTSNNAFDTDMDTELGYGILQSGPNGEIRGFAITGYSPCNGYWGYYGYSGYEYSCNYSFSDPNVENYINTTVISSDTMQGNIAEVMIKNITESYTCYTDPNDPQGSQVNCPSDISGMSKAIKAGLRKALAKAQLTAMQTCMNDVTFDYQETWRENTGWYSVQDTNDVDQDGSTVDYVCDNNFDGQITKDDDINGNGDIECWPQRAGGDGADFYVYYSSSSTMDICFHIFTAKAEPIPSNELNLIIQRK